MIKKNISKFIILGTETIDVALKKITENKNRIIFIVSSYGELIGSFSDGDFRRWVSANKLIRTTALVEEAMNKNPIFVSQDLEKNKIDLLFTDAIDLVPLVDRSNRIVALAHKNEISLKIGKHTISDESPAFVIAEIGNNHNGDIELAKKLVDLAIDASADCVKFQARDLESLYRFGGRQDISADLGSQYTLDLLLKFQLSNKELLNIFDYCLKKNIVPLCTPWDHKTLNLLENYGMEAYKVASADLTNTPLLQALVDTHKPLLCSTGMSTEAEIKYSANFLKDNNADFVLLHCNSTYPAPMKDINLNYIPKLKNLFHVPVGYSGHEEGISIPIAAVSIGARVIEKHFTLDKSMEGNDHKVSLLPSEFKLMVESIRQVEIAMGTDKAREISQGEMINRENLAKSMVINRDLAKGEKITNEMIDIKSPGNGLQPIYKKNLVGKIAKRNYENGDFFYESDLDEATIEPRNYNFARPFGIPVRYHDYEKLCNLSNLDLVEFHLSYNDLDHNPEDLIRAKQTIDFIVHSPELFANDHILNLASEDETYRKKSIKELNIVCEVTRKLNQIFHKTKRPKIVCNVGGFNYNGFIENNQKKNLYDLVNKSLNEVDQSNVEIIIQTMPPFPWHFGGKSHHNLFIEPDEIRSFCENYGYRICLDISHSMMACNFYQMSLIEFVDKICTYVAHLHISDAKGVDGEGVKMGLGDINFIDLCKQLDNKAPGISFIPEIWQGHKNNGEGFWIALNYLSNYFKKNK